MKPKHIFLVRHGETDWNKEQRMQGARDIPLNAKGRSQAQMIASYLSEYSFDVMYSSPLKRAHQTAQAIHSYHPNTPLITHRSLHERSFGVLDGKTYQEINEEYPELIFSNTWDYPFFRPPLGESLTDVRTRITRFIQSEIHGGKHSNILVVAHGVSLRILLTGLLNIAVDGELKYYHLDNASLSMIIMGKVPSVGFYNFTTHLIRENS